MDDVSTGLYHTCAIRSSDSSIICWGNNDEEQVSDAPTPEAFDAISAGFYHSCGIRSSDSEMVCWGQDDYDGQVSDLPD